MKKITRYNMLSSVAIATILPALFSTVYAQTNITADRFAEISERDMVENNRRYVGGFTYSPRFSVGVRTDSNIYPLENTVEENDAILFSKYSNELISNWNRHEVSLLGYLAYDSYSDHDDESGAEYGARVNTKLDVSSDSTFNFGVGYDSNLQSRSDTSSPREAKERVPYTTLSARGGFSQNLYRFNVNVGAGYVVYDYSDVDGYFGSEIEQDFRDSNTMDAVASLGYSISPSMQVFARVGMSESEYDPDKVGTVNRDNSTLSYSGGLQFSTSDLLSGEVEVGYLTKEYADAAKEEFSGLTVNGFLNWSPSRNTVVTLNGGRKINDSFVTGSDSYESTNFAVNVSQKIIRDIYLNGSLGMNNDEYDGIDRSDSRLNAGVGIGYHVRSNVILGVDLDFIELTSDGVDSISGYDNLIAAISSKFYF